MSYTRTQFIQKIAPMAQADAKTSKVLASLTIAQAILESNNGNSLLTQQGNALFGIKATSSWRGKVWTGKTIEYYDGKTATTIVDGFRAYANWEESIKDHSKLLTQASRYKAVVGEKDYKKACQAIHKAGYATDPSYAEKLIALIEKHNLVQYDITYKVIKEDPELAAAVSKLIKSGIQLQYNDWKRVDLIKLSNVPALLYKLGGLQKIEGKLKEKGMGLDLEVWQEKRYTADNVRSLIIKYAAAVL